MTISTPRRPRWLPREARRGYLNMKRSRLALKHGTKEWTYKGILTRIFGQGIQRVFKELPASTTAAVTGSMGVAAYDMLRNKRDLNWIPNDVDVFVAIPPSQQSKPLKKMFPMISKWKRSVEDQGFMYKLKKRGACYSNNMCIFDFVCTNSEDFPRLHLPKISFIGQPAKTVREICGKFDLPICGAIIRRLNKESPIKPKVTYEMVHLYQDRCFYSNIRPTLNTCRGIRTYRRIIKYQKREFEFFPKNYTHVPTTLGVLQGQFPKFPLRYYRANKPTCKQFIIQSLGREPTIQECADFNIAL